VNPAEHCARAEAERAGTIVGSDVDRIESALLAEPDDEGTGAWLVGETSLWGVESA
jgi:hypothetical protein